MAKGFKKQLQGGGYQNLTISGAAQLQNMRLQSDIEINALKEQRARQKQLDESNLTDLRRSYKSEKDNRDSIQKLEVNRQKLELENQQLLAKRDLENKQAEIKRKTAEANMWAKLSPTLGANLGKLATGLTKFNDIQFGMEQYRKLDAAGVLDNLGSAHFEMNKQATKGLQKDRNSAMLNNKIDEADYLGDIYRVSGYYGQKLIADEIKNKQEEIFSELRNDISDNDLLKNPYDTSDIYEFRGQEILKKFGIDPMSMAGLEISKVFKQEGAKQQTVAVLNSKHEIYQKNFIEDKKIFASTALDSPDLQDNFDQMVTTYMTGYTRNKNGSIVSHYGMVNAMEATEFILGEVVVSKPYATNWRKAQELIKKLQSPEGPGNPTRKYWTGKNPAMVQRVKELWTRNFNNLKDTNAALNEVEDTGKVFEIDEQNRKGDFDKEDGTAKLVAAYFNNQGNPNAQARAAKLLYVNQTENNKATVNKVMQAIRQDDFPEFISLIDGLSQEKVTNIVGAEPFLDTVNALREAHNGEDFDTKIESYATSLIGQLEATTFSQAGDANENAKRAIRATKQLYYYLFDKRYGGISNPHERHQRVEEDIQKLADDTSTQTIGNTTYIGKGIFRRISAEDPNVSVATFTQFTTKTLPGNVINLGKNAEIDLDVFSSRQALAKIKREGKNIISTTELEDIAIAVRKGQDTITLPDNLKILERKYKDFNARRYINNLFKESKLYYDSSQEGLERILFIPPSYVDVARHAGGNLQQKDALKYLIGAYKDGELVKGDAQ